LFSLLEHIMTSVPDLLSAIGIPACQQLVKHVSR
jgi:hypothetical protein